MPGYKQIDPESGKATRFKPGQSGNPTGPKPGYKHINTWVQEILEDENFEAWVSDPKEGIKLFKGAPIKAIIKAQVIKAVNGDSKAYDSLHRSGYAQRMETDIHVKELPKPLLEGLDVSSNDLDTQDSTTEQTS